MDETADKILEEIMQYLDENYPDATPTERLRATYELMTEVKGMVMYKVAGL